MSSSSTQMPSGVCSAGLSTTQLPAASAGASFQAAISSGSKRSFIEVLDSEFERCRMRLPLIGR